MVGTRALVCREFVETDDFARSRAELPEQTGLTIRELDDRMEALGGPWLAATMTTRYWFNQFRPGRSGSPSFPGDSRRFACTCDPAARRSTAVNAVDRGAPVGRWLRVGRAGFEPATLRLRVSCSTN